MPYCTHIRPGYWPQSLQETAVGRVSFLSHCLTLRQIAHGALNVDRMPREKPLLTSCRCRCGTHSQVLTLVDLAGHERYFRTTAYGLTGHLPDYACLIVGANMGVVGMCKVRLRAAAGCGLRAAVPHVMLCPHRPRPSACSHPCGVHIAYL